jgi:hypothetical protein
MTKTIRTKARTAKASLKSWTIRYNAAVATAAGLWFALQDAMPDVRAALDPKIVLGLVVANAIIGFWLRSRTTKSLADRGADK